MSKIAIWKGLGRRRKSASRRRGHRRTRRSIRGIGYSKSVRFHHRKSKSAGKAKTIFGTAAKVCKVEFKKKGSPKQRMLKYRKCIKNYMLAHI
jgi:hypothetical protein